MIGWGDSAARLVNDTVIDGRFPLRIVLDCTALDVQALYLSAVMAAPLSWRIKLGGALGGLVFLGGANLLRIAALYFVGAYAPGHFDVVHEDVATIVMMALACLAFAVVLTQLRDTPRAAAS